MLFTSEIFNYQAELTIEEIFLGGQSSVVFSVVFQLRSSVKINFSNLGGRREEERCAGTLFPSLHFIRCLLFPITDSKGQKSEHR